MMIIDDCARLIVGGQIFYNDNAYNFQKVLKQAISTYGIPDKLYMDSGAPYRNAQLSFICSSVGCVELHTPVRDGASKDDIEGFLLNALKNCYTKEREPGLGALEKHFGVKSWIKAVNSLKFVSFTFIQKEGYRFIPSIKTLKKGYNHPQEEKWIHVGIDPQKGELAEAFDKAFRESTCYKPNIDHPRILI